MRPVQYLLKFLVAIIVNSFKYEGVLLILGFVIKPNEGRERESVVINGPFSIETKVFAFISECNKIGIWI